MTLRFSTFAFFVLICGPLFAQGTPAIERLIVDDNPCAALPQIDRLDFVRIDRVSLVAQGDTLSGNLTGSMGCRTSSSALFQASLAADISVTVSVSLSQCQVLDRNVAFSNVRGNAGPLLTLLQPIAESTLQREIEPTAVAACREMTTP